MTATRNRRQWGHARGTVTLFATIEPTAFQKVNDMADRAQLSLGQVMDGIIEHAPDVTDFVPAVMKRRPRGTKTDDYGDLFCSIGLQWKTKLKRLRMAHGLSEAATVEKLINECDVDENGLPLWGNLQPALLGADSVSSKQGVLISAG